MSNLEQTANDATDERERGFVNWVDRVRKPLVGRDRRMVRMGGRGVSETPNQGQLFYRAPISTCSPSQFRITMRAPVPESEHGLSLTHLRRGIGSPP